MVYIMATLLRKAFEKHDKFACKETDKDDIWKHLMLLPEDYSEKALFNE